MTLPRDWKAECFLLQVELDTIKKELEESKQRWERLLLWEQQPRLPVRGMTTMKHIDGDDGK